MANNLTNASGIVPGSPDDYILDTYANIPREEPSYLWEPYFPPSAITVIAGYPGGGKSSIALDIAARAARGDALPDGSHVTEKITVAYQCTEVGKLGIITTILDNARAPLDAIHLIRGSKLKLADVRIERAIKESNAKVLIFDPMQQFFEKDMNTAQTVRRELSILTDYAVKYDCAVILIGHFAKDTPSEALYHGLGSAEIAAVPRSILHVIRPDERSSFGYLRQVKNSYGALGSDFAFEINDLGKVDWIGPVDEDEKESLITETMKATAPKTTAAMTDMYNLLHERDYPYDEIFPLLMSKGHTRATILVSKKQLGVDSIKRGKWYWHLPEDAQIEA